MKSKKIARIFGVAAIMGAAAFMGNGNILGLEGNQTVVSAYSYYDTVTSTDGNWKFTMDGTIQGYLGNETEVTIPTTLTFDGVEYAIKGCTWGALSYNDTIEVINVPAEIVEIPSQSFSKNPALREINVSEDNEKYCSIQGVLYNKAKTVLMKVPSHTISGSLILPDTITSMYGHAIEENHKITYLKIPAGYVSSLTRFVGMDNLRALEHIDVDEENAKYKAVNGVLYNKESTIVLLYPPCKRDQSFELMPCVKFLDEDSFLNVKYLKNFSFNQNEIELKDGQFDSMELTSINHITTREEYNALDNDIKSNIQNNLYSLEGQPIITSLVEQEIDYAIATYLDESNMTIYEKIKALYDYAVDKVEYDHEDMQNDNNHCPSSLFLRDKTVCEGYALAMKLLLDKAGIRNEMLITDPSNKAGHAWNIVNIDGNWLHIDATWDDEDDGTLGADITYFLKTTEEYAKLHHRVDYHVENDRFGDYSWAVVDPSLHNTKPECNMLFGDLDADGVLTIKDVLSMRDEIRAFGNYSYMNYYNITADMNRDGAINMSDYNILNNIVSSQTAE